MFLSAEYLLVKSLPKHIPFNYSPAMGGHEEENNWDYINAHFLTTSVRDNVGKITTQACIHRDLGLHFGNGNLYDNTVIALSFMQGWEIDKAKTGFSFSVPEDCVTKKVPHWMLGVKEIKGRSISPKAEPYNSKSPMGLLFDHVNEFKKTLKDIIVKKDRTLKFALHCDMAEAVRILPMVKALEHNYRLELAGLAKAKINDEQRKVLQSDIYAQYASLLSFLSTDEKAIAYAVYQTAYVRSNNESKSLSMPWTCAFNGMLQLLYENGNSKQLVKLPRWEDDLIESVIVNNTGMLFINDCPNKMTDYPAGNYEIIIIEDDKYIAVPKSHIVQTPSVILTEETFYRFNVGGFRFHDITAFEAIDLIHSNNNQFTVVNVGDFAEVFVNSTWIGRVDKADNALTPQFLNKQLKLIGNPENNILYVPSEKTLRSKSTVMHTDGIHAIQGFVMFQANTICSVDANDACYANATKVDTEEVYYAESTDDCSSYEADYNVDPSYYEELQCEESSVAEENAIYSSEPTITKVSTPAVEVLDATIVSKLAKQSYWNVQSLVKPAVVDSYTCSIATKSLRANVLVGTVKIIAKGKPYSFDVVVNGTGKGLNLVTANMPKSQDMIDWIYRVVTYNFYL